MESQLNRSLERVNIQEFVGNHKITFNASKSTVSLFMTNRHPYNYSPELFLMSECLKTSSFILNLTRNQYLKQDRPLNYLWKRDFIHFNVDASTPFSCITPIDSFNHVEFQEELLTSTLKYSSHPELLRQLGLEVINGIPDQALIIYTDGSRLDMGGTGSGIFSNTPGNGVKISIRNSKHCSIFRSELTAISDALD
ncbi:putative RNA-directed DNA polymerase from transposon BS [Trichonephila clavipes]|nr:putative RNA-directed DNA polymerase from transposon BS [Trichonephila clavipes]